MDKNKRIQIIVIAGFVLTIISLFLTLYKASFMDKNISDSIFNAYKSQGRTATTLIFIIAPALATLFVLLKKKIPVIVFGLLQCCLWALLTSTFKEQLGSGVKFSYGIGFYIGLIGAIIIVAGGIYAVVTKAFKK